MKKIGTAVSTLCVALVLLCTVFLAPALQGQQLAATVALGSGISPTSFALDAPHYILYVGADVGAYGGAIYAIYLPTASLIGSVSLPGEPQSIAYSQATGLLYATNVNQTVNSDITVINTRATPVTTTTVHVGLNPSMISVNPVNGKVYTADYNNSSVSVIDPSNNNSTVTIPHLTAYPWNLGFDPSSGEVYVTAAGGVGCNCNSTLTVIDPMTNAVTATVPVGKLPYTVAVDPQTHSVYVANITDGTVNVISPSLGYTVTKTLSTGPYSQPWAIALDSAGRLFVALRFLNQVAVIDPSQSYSVTNINVGSFPVAVVFDSGANVIGVLNITSNTVSYISPESLLVTATIDVGLQYGDGAIITNGTFEGTAVANANSGTVSLVTD